MQVISYHKKYKRFKKKDTRFFKKENANICQKSIERYN